MPHRDPQIIAGEGGDKRSARISMDQNHIRLYFVQNLSDGAEDAGGNIEKCLSVFHDVEIIVRHDAKGIQDLVKHLAVLRSNAHHRLYARPFS